MYVIVLGPAQKIILQQRSAEVGAPGLVKIIPAVLITSASVYLQHSQNLVHRLELIAECSLVKFVPAVAFHSCLNLTATFSQLRTSIISGPSIICGMPYLG